MDFNPCRRTSRRCPRAAAADKRRIPRSLWAVGRWLWTCLAQPSVRWHRGDRVGAPRMAVCGAARPEASPHLVSPPPTPTPTPCITGAGAVTPEGGLRRISNWQELSEEERAVAWRRIKARNRVRVCATPARSAAPLACLSPATPLHRTPPIWHGFAGRQTVQPGARHTGSAAGA